MPLCLGQEPSFELPKRIVWDPLLPEEEAQARKAIDGWRSQGFVVSEFDGEALLEPPPMPTNSLLVRVLTPEGDLRLVWNRSKPEEVRQARESFDDYLAQGYRAYVSRLDGSRGSRVDSFDALMEELILEKSKQGLMVPKTKPG